MKIIRIILCCIVCIYGAGPVQSQNLVVNGNFEQMTACPAGISEIDKVVGWKFNINHQGTSDYYNVCAAGISGASVPKNQIGYQQPLSGNGYVGAVQYGNDNFREYLITKLFSPLESGKKYMVSLNYSLAERSSFLINCFGVHFGTTVPDGGNTYKKLNLTPQWTSNAFLSDTSQWRQLSFPYKATGGEEYMIFGNFSETSIANGNLQTLPFGDGNYCYMYFDDISVTPIDIIGNTHICEGDSATLLSLDSIVYGWAEATAPATIFSIDSIIKVAPTVTTTYLCYGYPDTFSVTVNVQSKQSHPAINDPFGICVGGSLQVDLHTIAPHIYWSDGDSNAVKVVHQPGTYTVSYWYGQCIITDSFEIVQQDTIPQLLPSGLNLCFTQSMTFHPEVPAPVSYLWQDGSTDEYYYVNGPGVYTLTASNACGQHTESITFENCLALNCEIPNAFTPNDDELNDVFGVRGCLFDEFQLRIFNRWGEEVFASNDVYRLWDGTYQGKDASEGVYFYIMNYRISGQVNKVRTGTITLIR